MAPGSSLGKNDAGHSVDASQLPGHGTLNDKLSLST
jgi:hypothetical protein